MSFIERAARLYCKKKGVDPDERMDGQSNWGRYAIDLEEMELKLWCLKQAEDPKTTEL